MKEIFLRHANPEDYAACRRLTNQKENRAGFGPVSRVTFNDFAERQKIEPRYILRVAEDAVGNIVGYVRALRLKDRSQTTIHEICRDANLKGMGIGTALLDDVAALSLRDETRTLFLKAPDGIPSNRAYESYGFKMTGIDTPVEGEHRKKTIRTYEKIL